MTGNPIPANEATDPYLGSLSAAADLLRGAPWKRLVAIGDSAAEGVSEPLAGYQDITWMDRLVTALQQVQPDLEYRNLGVRNLLAEQVRQTQLEPALAFAPDLAVVFCGGNDMLQRTFDLDAVEAELTTLFSALLATGATVLTSGLFDITNSPYVQEKYRAVMSQRIAELSQRAKEVAGRHGVIYLDLPLHPAGAETSMYSSDGLHPNARGQAVLAAEIVAGLGKSLRQG